MFNVFTEYHIIAHDKDNGCYHCYLIILAVPTTKSITAAYSVSDDVTCFNANPLVLNIGLGMQKSITK